AQQLQTASQQISGNAQQLSSGTARQRQLIGHGRADSEAAASIAAQLHGRAQEAERQINAVAQQARRHGEEIARASELLVSLVAHLDQVSHAAGTLEQGSREIGKLVDSITRIASQTEGQVRRMREVVQRMEEVAGIADSAAHGAEQTSAATEQQIASLGELTTTSQQLAVAAARLTETIQRFNVDGAKLPPP